MISPYTRVWRDFSIKDEKRFWQILPQISMKKQLYFPLLKQLRAQIPIAPIADNVDDDSLFQLRSELAGGK